MGIKHHPSLNHITNLVFARAIEGGVMAEEVDSLPAMRHAFGVSEALELLGQRSPKLIRAHCVYLVDVLAVILNHLSERWKAVGRSCSDRATVPASASFVPFSGCI
jgi:hypothetical protein